MVYGLDCVCGVFYWWVGFACLFMLLIWVGLTAFVFDVYCTVCDASLFICGLVFVVA